MHFVKKVELIFNGVRRC